VNPGPKPTLARLVAIPVLGFFGFLVGSIVAGIFCPG
jgi:hypothetical protein